jgi:hypothetical protein
MTKILEILRDIHSGALSLAYLGDFLLFLLHPPKYTLIHYLE